MVKSEGEDEETAVSSDSACEIEEDEELSC